MAGEGRLLILAALRLSRFGSLPLRQPAASAHAYSSYCYNNSYYYYYYV